MPESLGTRLKHAWSVFNQVYDDKPDVWRDYGNNYSLRPDRVRLNVASDKSIIGSIYTRLSIDVAAEKIQHVRQDEDGRYAETMNSGLNYCLTAEANVDQAARAFRQDAAMTLFDKGVIVLVPVETTLNPNLTGGYDIKTLQVGHIVSWFPEHVRVSLYNSKLGRREELTLAKSTVAIVENPLYAVMNETNGTLQRLIRKLSLLDAVDDASGSGKLDLIIQLPYVVKTEARAQQASKRAKDIEMQLKGSKYGIAYTDGTEKITQLNRPAENNLLGQVEYLTGMLYAQLGLTEDVFSGKADETTMINYYNRTIEPVLAAITEAMSRSFLTKTARSQGQAIAIYRDPFKNVPLAAMAEIADKFTRNEILTSNEIRAAIGVRPAKDSTADKLLNKNMPAAKTGAAPAPAPTPTGDDQNGSI